VTGYEAFVVVACGRKPIFERTALHTLVFPVTFDIAAGESYLSRCVEQLHLQSFGEFDDPLG